MYRELGLASFGDARLTARAVRLARDIAAHPDLSLASLYTSDWVGLKGYRFVDNPKDKAEAKSLSVRDLHDQFADIVAPKEP